MLNQIIKFSVYNKGVVLFFTLIMAIAGIFIGFRLLPIDAVPDITNNQVQINTTISGLAPEEIERSITIPMETAMRGLAHIDEVRSITRSGLSQITIVFDDGIALYQARQMVSERLQGVMKQLPDRAEPELGPVSTGLGEIYQYTLDYKVKASDPAKRFEQLVALRTLHDWTLKPRLLTVAGIAEINSSGGYEKVFQIKPDIAQMQRYGISFDALRSAINKVNRNVGGGIVQQTGEQFLVQGIGLFKGTGDISNIPIKQLESLQMIRLGEVASIAMGKEQRSGAATLNGEEVVLGTAMMLLGENSRTVATRFDAKIKEVAETLPAEFELKPVYNRSVLVDQTLGTVEHNLLMGALLVTVVLMLLLGNVRAAVITALTIPLTLCVTFLIMRPLGISGNLMSLGALDFGMIVDGTVIVLDHCVRVIQAESRLLGRRLSREEVRAAVYRATVEIRSAAGFGELIIVVVFLPIFGLIGVEGKMFQPMAATFAIAVMGALVLSFTAVPALAGLILSGNPATRDPLPMRLLRRVYEPILAFSFRVKTLFIALALGLVVLSFILFGKLGAVFLPQLGEGSFAFHMIRPVNISLDQSIEFQKVAEKVLASFPEVDHVFSRIGTSEVATDPMGVNVSDTYIMLKDRKDWPKDSAKEKSYEGLVEEMLARLELEVPGQNYLASQPIQMRFNELLEGTRADVAIKVFGNKLEENLEVAEKIQDIVAKLQGSGDVELDLAGTSPVLRIEPLAEGMSRYGTSTSEVLEAVSIAMGGEEVGHIFEEEKRFPLLIKLAEEERGNLDIIRNIPVLLTNGVTVPLQRLAKVGFEETFGSITRENGARRAAVLVNLRGRDTESWVMEAKEKIQKELKLPEGSYIEWGGNFKNLEEARTRLLILTPIALILVFFMVYAAFGNLLETALIFLCIPFAWVGGILNLYIHDLSFSISAGVGFIALSGIAVLNGVVLIGFFNSSLSEGKTGLEMIKEAAASRLRPVVMTALVAIFGFLPMMLSSGLGAEVQKPLATVVTGGVFTSTFLTLFLLPMLFSFIETSVRKSNFKVSQH
jgi:cobalt-zinc-cadmium resistance protein CzcA